MKMSRQNRVSAPVSFHRSIWQRLIRVSRRDFPLMWGEMPSLIPHGSRALDIRSHSFLNVSQCVAQKDMVEGR